MKVILFCGGIIGMRLKAVEKHLGAEELFLTNYTDGLSDVDLDALVEAFLRSKRLACFVSVKPRASFHMITVDEEGVVKSIEHIAKSGARRTVASLSSAGKSFNT